MDPGFLSSSLAPLPFPKTATTSHALVLQNLLQLRNNGITHVLGSSASTKILGAGAVVNGALDGGLNSLGLIRQTQRVSEHHGNRKDGADGVDDALARNVGCRAYIFCVSDMFEFSRQSE